MLEGYEKMSNESLNISKEFEPLEDIRKWEW